MVRRPKPFDATKYFNFYNRKTRPQKPIKFMPWFNFLCRWLCKLKLYPYKWDSETFSLTFQHGERTMWLIWLAMTFTSQLITVTSDITALVDTIHQLISTKEATKAKRLLLGRISGIISLTGIRMLGLLSTVLIADKPAQLANFVNTINKYRRSICTSNKEGKDLFYLQLIMVVFFFRGWVLIPVSLKHVQAAICKGPEELCSLTDNIVVKIVLAGLVAYGNFSMYLIVLCLPVLLLYVSTTVRILKHKLQNSQTLEEVVLSIKEMCIVRAEFLNILGAYYTKGLLLYASAIMTIYVYSAVKFLGKVGFNTYVNAVVGVVNCCGYFHFFMTPADSDRN